MSSSSARARRRTTTACSPARSPAAIPSCTWNTRNSGDCAARSIAASTVPLGRARIVRAGRDLTLVTWSRALQESLQAADELAREGIEVEVIDLRTLWPWDRETVLASAARTQRLLVVHEAVQVAGFGAEVAATVAEELGCPVKRLGAPRIPVGYAPTLEAEARVVSAKIARLARTWLNR